MAHAQGSSSPGSRMKVAPAPFRLVSALVMATLLGFAAHPTRAFATEDAAEMSVQMQAAALGRANASVIGVRSQAIEDARSSSTLGADRRGSGVVIGADGLVLTIGYLILESERVDLMLDDNRSVPARVIAYDLATGFGLLQALAPLHVPVAPLGDASRLKLIEPLMFASGGAHGDVGMVSLVSNRAFSGYWEYQIDSALYTAPARSDHSGAGLFNSRGELVGIGSLLLSDTLGGEGAGEHPAVPGNVFVPIDLLKPILAELRENGLSHASLRPWLGLNCVEVDGHVQVLRVTEDSPADIAGLQQGDAIESVDGTEISGLETLWKALWRNPQAEREVVLEIRRNDEPQTLKLQSVDRMKTLRHPQGI